MSVGARVRLVVVGNGVAGISCALDVRARDPSADITVISGETDYFFSRTALMYAFMDRLQRRELEPFERRIYDEQRITRLRDWVTDLDVTTKTLTLQAGAKVPYDRLVFAVGARARRPAWSGIDDVTDGLVNFVSMQDLDACERLVPSTRRAVVVGGGLIGIELVECLRHFDIPVTFLVREAWYWPVALGVEESAFVVEHMRKHGVDVRLGEEIASVESSGRVQSVTTAKGEKLPCEFLGVAIGVQPNIDRIRSFSGKPEMARGILVDAALRTSLPDVYACGDCAEIRRDDGKTLLETIWYSAKRQGRLCAKSVLGDPAAYAPPIFFNSSKFFDIEFTTVGDVMNTPDGTPTIFLKHPRRDISARIIHDGKRVLGFNMLGSRWNHEVLQQWIAEAREPGFVVENLKMAQFDVELGRVDLKALQRQDLPLRTLRA